MYLKDSSTEEMPVLFGMISFTTVCIILGTPLLYGIIRFENLGQYGKRTLLNMMAATICWLNIWMLVLDRPLEILLYTTGPWPPIMCQIKVGIKFFIVISIGLCFTASVLVRYLFIFWIKNPMALNDKFWHKVLVLWIMTCTGILTNVSILGTESKSALYRYCTGSPLKSNEQDLPIFFGVIIVAGSIALHLAIKVRISIYEIREKSFPETKLVYYKSAFIEAMKETELFSFAANIICFIIVLMSIWNTLRIRKSSEQSWSSNINDSTIMIFQLGGPTLFTMTIVASFYRKKAVRKFVLAEIKRIFRL